MLIEEREGNDLISSEMATDAIFGMLHARIVCHEGRVLDALALYDDITQDLTIQFGRGQ